MLLQFKLPTFCNSSKWQKQKELHKKPPKWLKRTQNKASQQTACDNQKVLLRANMHTETDKVVALEGLLTTRWSIDCLASTTKKREFKSHHLKKPKSVSLSHSTFSIWLSTTAPNSWMNILKSSKACSSNNSELKNLKITVSQIKTVCRLSVVLSTALLRKVSSALILSVCSTSEMTLPRYSNLS